VSSCRHEPGVIGAFTAADLGLPDLGDPGQPAITRPVLATDRVRFVGEAVAVVVADSLVAAVDAAEAVVVDIEPFAAIVSADSADDASMPLLFPDHGSNVVGGRHREPEEGFFGSDEVVSSARIVHQRLAPVTMEANGVIAYSDSDGGLDVWASTQGVFGVRDQIAASLSRPPDSVRVRAPSVGGGFGAKGGTYPEQIIVAALAERLGAPVRWVETRTENLLGMTHGRAQIHDMEVGVTPDGRLGGLRVAAWADTGAYAGRGGFIPMITRRMSAGVYRWKSHEFAAKTMFTNTTPTGPYRGAGRPEAAALTERAVDMAAAAIGLDPSEIRRRNFPDPDEFPFTTAAGQTYDTGDYRRVLEKALETIDYDALRREQAARRSAAEEMPAGSLMGIGIGCYVESSGNGAEYGSVTVEGDGSVTVVSGSVPNGQGHETMWAQIASSVLGVDFDKVAVVHSDTARVDHGVGTFGSRSVQLAGSAVLLAAEEVLELAKAVAADMLEAAVGDIIVDDEGRLGVAGVPAAGLSWGELAATARDRGLSLAHELDFSQDGTFPFGCHVAVVEVDRETGQVVLRDQVAVDDCGTVINPLLAQGQVHGGLAQGIAQILFEEVRYDDSGTPLTATLVDYGVPSAADLPSFRTQHTVTPTPKNPLGAKGVGESGTTGAIASMWNAVVDALAPLGITHLNPPFTAERVWTAIHRR
jgi:aerobic carbon-monoxide dehydrogenase large subunit